MRLRSGPLALLTLPLLLAACTAPSTPSAPTVDAQNIKLHLSPLGGLSTQGIPSGLTPARTHLKVIVTTADGHLVTFKNGVYAPAGDGDTFLTLNAANNFSVDVLLPAKDYRFETILKDGTDESTTSNTLLGYNLSDATAVNAQHSNVRLTVHTVLNTDDTTLGFALPTDTVYTSDKLDLRLRAKSHALDNGDGGTDTFNVPLNDYSVGAYTATNGVVNAAKSSKLGTVVTAVGTTSDPSVTVTVPVTAWVQDEANAEHATLTTFNVSFTHPVVLNSISTDVTAPTATLTVNQELSPVTVSGTAEDQGGRVEAVRLFDGVELVASTAQDEQDAGAAPITFEDGSTTWQTAWTPAMGAHELTLIAEDSAGNETRQTQTFEVSFHDREAPVINQDSIYASGGLLSFTVTDNVGAVSGSVFRNGELIGTAQTSDNDNDPTSTNMFVFFNNESGVQPGDVLVISAYDAAQNVSEPVTYVVPGVEPEPLP
ncbi:hypothetical protein [Deinococcus maricopensis]|uniref:Bacterial Ig-like domain-containing protein n=1 Tax=Deinococcus maricopensis (strain DSM 21211 / LMG 22137 / NRRL B-23946 / LB-34) TaxID=709986 RepID=E8U3A2_DEIML|nr:hypothetical protein [Deinococcus maricopensis]ADV66047.1 hypothetical protein Deima_0387 [Deinococcus maricopensis DSM 21211]